MHLWQKILASGAVFLWSMGAYGAEILLHTVEFPPYEIEEPQDGLHGHDVEVIQETFEIMQQPLRIVFAPWKRSILLGKQGKIDGIFSCTYSAEREPHYILSDPISGITPIVITPLSLKDRNITSLKDLEGLAVVGLRGYAYTEELISLGYEPHILNTDEQAIRFISLGRAAAFYTIMENTLFLARKEGLSGTFALHRLEEKSTTLFHLCFSKHRPGFEALLAKFNAALKKLRESGRYDEIHARYK